MFIELDVWLLCAECKIDFQNQNYTIITSRCKGPIFPPKQCCDAFLEFACPFADAINDLKNECSVTMFTYINLYGKYPPGIFSNLCVGGQGGIDCPEESKVEKEKKEKEEKEKKKKSIGIKMGVTHSTLLIIIAANFLVIFLFHSFWRIWKCGCIPTLPVLI